MIKARIMDNDPELIDWNAHTILFDRILLEQQGKKLVIIESKQSLPINKTIKLDNTTYPIFVTYQAARYSEETQPSLGNNFCKLRVDKNGIFTIIFHNTEDENPFPPVNAYFAFPEKISTNDIEIEAVGIDLGTSRCCAAVNRRNGIETVVLENTGGRLIPSYVCYKESEEKCGELVVKNLRHNFDSTVFDAKRIIGKKFNEIEIDSTWPFLIKNLNNEVWLQVKKVGIDSLIKAEEVGAVLLKHIKKQTEDFQGKQLLNAVITVPAVFTDFQKDATLNAALLAGWKNVHLLPEPIAASFAYFIDNPIPNNLTMLLFDLGGGTLDVCISKIENNQIQVISKNGDSKLGGRDFDNALCNYFQNSLAVDYGISTANSKFKLLLECQNLKEALSTVETVSLFIDDFETSKDGAINISRADFEKLAFHLLNRIRNTINAALFSANYKSSQIDKILQVGGGSRMPMVKKLLKEMFPNSEHCCAVNPDEVVAVGAAYFAYTFFS